MRQQKTERSRTKRATPMKMSMRKKVRSPIVLDDSSEEPRVEETDERRARALPGTGRGDKQRVLSGDERV